MKLFEKRSEDRIPGNRVRQKPLAVGYRTQAIVLGRASVSSSAAGEEKKEASDHYHSVADKYDQLKLYDSTGEKGVFPWFISKIMRSLELSSDDQIFDIGGGTGQVASALHQRAGLSHPVTCVEPSPSMCALASRHHDGVVPVCMDADTFSSSDNLKKGNVFILKESIHHVKHLQVFLDRFGLALSRTTGKRVLIITRPTMKGFPLFHAVLKMLNSEARDFVIALRIMLMNSRLTVDIKPRMFKHTFTRKEFLDMVRGCFWSTLHRFSADERSDGIREIEERHPDTAHFNIPDRFLFITATGGSLLPDQVYNLPEAIRKPLSQLEEAIMVWAIRTANLQLNPEQLPPEALIADEVFRSNIEKISEMMIEEGDGVALMTDEALKFFMEDLVSASVMRATPRL